MRRRPTPMIPLRHYADLRKQAPNGRMWSTSTALAQAGRCSTILSPASPCRPREGSRRWRTWTGCLPTAQSAARPCGRAESRSRRRFALPARRIIPCLDVKDGRVVKGVQFRDHRDAGDIVEHASRYREEGADELVFYDITASAERRSLDPAWVRRVAQVIDIPFAVAGGVRT